MLLFQYLGQYFWDLGTYFGTIAYRCQGDPTLDYIVGWGMRQASYMCSYISNRFYEASDWSDTVYTDPDTIVADIQNPLVSIFGILGYAASQMWDWIKGFLLFDYYAITELTSAVMFWGRSTLEYWYGILTMDALGVFTWIQEHIEAAYEIVTKDPAALVTWIWPVLEPLVGAGGATFEAIWTWITDGPLQAWIDSWAAGLQDQVTGWVEGSLEYLMHSAFNVLSWSWSSFTGECTWLLDQLIDLVWDQAAHFAGPLWSLLERILANIDTGR